MQHNNNLSGTANTVGSRAPGKLARLVAHT